MNSKEKQRLLRIITRQGKQKMWEDRYQRLPDSQPQRDYPYFEAPKKRRHSEPTVMKVEGVNPLDWTLEKYYELPFAYGEHLRLKGSTVTREWKRWLTRLTDQRIQNMYESMEMDINMLRFKKRVHRTYAKKRPYIDITEKIACDEAMTSAEAISENSYKKRIVCADQMEKQLLYRNAEINLNN